MNTAFLWCYFWNGCYLFSSWDLCTTRQLITTACEFDGLCLCAATDAHCPWCARCLYTFRNRYHCSAIWSKFSAIYFLFVLYKLSAILEIRCPNFSVGIQCREHLELLLDSIPTMFQESKTPESAFAAAVKVWNFWRCWYFTCFNWLYK